MNACVFCKHGKRTCSKARPSCSNCSRYVIIKWRSNFRTCHNKTSISLGKACVYREDLLHTNWSANRGRIQPSNVTPGTANQETVFEIPDLRFSDPKSSVYHFSHETLGQPTIDLAVQAQALRILGSVENMHSISSEFFVGTHQRIPALSRFRFYKNLPSLTRRPRADFTALCLCINLIQQMPSAQTISVQSSLYITVKNLINLLDATCKLSLNIVHCRLLLTFYEMGHGLHTAAYASIAACARIARALGLHRKVWRNPGAEADITAMEEEKRTWWAIVNLDRFINLCNGDALFAADDPETSDPLPIEDLVWSEDSVPANLEASISAAPILATPSGITVGQMARECQVSHLAGRVVRHIFNPTSDPSFNAEEALQLERTLIAFLSMLADEELKIGNYCGAFGICNRFVTTSLTISDNVPLVPDSYSALFTLYEFQLGHKPEDGVERHRILRSMEETSARAIIFAEASYGDRENFHHETLSPYLPYSLSQAAIIQYRLWKQNDDRICKNRFESLMGILKDFSRRWLLAGET